MLRFLSGSTSPAFGPGAGSISTVIGQLTASMRASSGRLSSTGNHSEDVYVTSALSFDTGILFQFSGSNHFNPGDHIALKLTSTNNITAANTLTTMYTTVFKYKLD